MWSSHVSFPRNFFKNSKHYKTTIMHWVFLFMGVVVVLPLVIAFGSCMLSSFFANDEQDVSPLPLVFSLVTFFRSRFKVFLPFNFFKAWFPWDVWDMALKNLLFVKKKMLVIKTTKHQWTFQVFDLPYEVHCL